MWLTGPRQDTARACGEVPVRGSRGTKPRTDQFASCSQQVARLSFLALFRLLSCIMLTPVVKKRKSSQSSPGQGKRDCRTMDG